MIRFLVFLFCLCSAFGANLCVRPSASGGGTGADWNNALGASFTPVRGNTYYIADGTYGDYIFDEAESGTSVITIKKATEADHGPATGWSSAYGDGSATFGTLSFARDYYVIDGAFRNESQWDQQNSYGFRIDSVQSWTVNFPPGGDNLTFQYCDIGGAYTESFVGDEPDSFYIVANSGSLHDVAFSRCFLHNNMGNNLLGVDGFLVEYCFLGPGWGKEAIRGNGMCRNGIIRHNIFRNASQKDPTDATSGTTADIGIWNGDNDNIEIYGNIIYNTIDISHALGVILVGGDTAQGLDGPSTNNSKLYNNTVVGIQSGNASMKLNGGTNNRAFNNLYYDNSASVSVGANATGNNLVASSNPFVNVAGGDFRLAAGSSPINAGSSQGSPYNVDLYGTVRGADGLWDIGALEFSSGGQINCNTLNVTTLRIGQ